MSKLKCPQVYIPIFGFGKSGGYRVLSYIANGLATKNYPVTFLVAGGTESPYYPTIDKVNIVKVNKTFTHENTMANKRRNDFKIPQAILQLLCYLRNHCGKNDIVLANQNLTSYPVWLCGKGKRFYYIQAYEPELISGNILDVKTAPKKFMAWASYYLPLTRIVNAPIYQKYKNIRANYVSFPGIDKNNFYPRSCWRRESDQLRVGCIGRKEVWKGGHIAANAIAKLRSNGYKINLSVAFNPLPIQDQELLIPKSDKELGEFYRSVDLVLVSTYGQHGSIHYPVIESMACNVPLVTTEYYPATLENSFLVKARSEDSIYEAIKKAYCDYDLAIKKAAIAVKSAEEFRWEKVLENFEHIIAQT